MKRQGISKKIRFEVFKRDSFKCQYCGRSAPEVILHVDHIEPVSKGGANEILNMVTSCLDCNLGKSNRRLSDDAALKKQKAQLDAINERREQIEMMAQWQKELIALDNQASDRAAEIWLGFTPGYSLTESGKLKLKILIDKYGFESVVEAMRLSSMRYLPAFFTGNENEQVANAFHKIGGICHNRREEQSDPMMGEIRHIRSIIMQRFYYVPPYCVSLIKTAIHKNGLDIKDVFVWAHEAKNWSEFSEYLELEPKNA